jgi:hypothetical protein
MATFYVGKKFVDRPFSYILISQNTKKIESRITRENRKNIETMIAWEKKNPKKFANPLSNHHSCKTVINGVEVKQLQKRQQKHTLSLIDNIPYESWPSMC